MVSEESSDEPAVADLRDVHGILSSEWSRWTWYGKPHLSWEVPLLLLLTLISFVTVIAFAFESVESRWPSKYKEEVADNRP